MIDVQFNTPSKPIYGEVPLETDEHEAPEPNTLIIENPALRNGFTITPNYILRNQAVSFGAKLTYALLLSYAWQEGNCFPGQARLGDDLGVTRKAVNKYLGELKQKGFVTWTRRGMGKTNVYYILDYKPGTEADVTKRLHQDVTACSHQDVTSRLHKEYSVEEDPEEKDSDLSKFRKDEEQKEESTGLDSTKVAQVIDGLSKRELNDPTHVNSNITQAQNLWHDSKSSEDQFVELIQEARKRTLQHSGVIFKTTDGRRGAKNRAPYFFKVLKTLMRQAQFTEQKHTLLSAMSIPGTRST